MRNVIFPYDVNNGFGMVHNRIQNFRHLLISQSSKDCPLCSLALDYHGSLFSFEVFCILIYLSHGFNRRIILSACKSETIWKWMQELNLIWDTNIVLVILIPILGLTGGICILVYMKTRTQRD